MAVFGASSPQPVDEPLGRDDPSGFEQQRREERALPLPAEGDRPARALDLERAQYPELERHGRPYVCEPRLSIGAPPIGHGRSSSRIAQCKGIRGDPVQETLKAGRTSAVSRSLAPRCRPVGAPSDRGGMTTSLTHIAWRPVLGAVLALAVATSLGTARSAAGGAAPDTRVPILMYHVLGDPPAGAPFPDLYVPTSDFGAQLRWLARHGYHPVTLRRVWEHWRRGSPLPSKPVVVSFDDGHRSTAEAALPRLRERGWPGVLNLTAEPRAQVGLRPRRVRALIAAGWEIDAHSITHPTSPRSATRSSRPRSRCSRQSSGCRWRRRRLLLLPRRGGTTAA